MRCCFVLLSSCQWRWPSYKKKWNHGLPTVNDWSGHGACLFAQRILKRRHHSQF